jgi:hypothetical protein
MGAQLLVEVFIEHLGAGLRAMSDRNCCLRTYRTGIALPLAK